MPRVDSVELAAFFLAQGISSTTNKWPESLERFRLCHQISTNIIVLGQKALALPGLSMMLHRQSVFELDQVDILFVHFVT